MEKLRFFVPIAILTTAFSGLAYLVAQQDIRQDANDPQIQMAEDIAANLSSGEDLNSTLPAKKIDISKSLSPFVIIYDANGSVLSSNAELSGQVPQLPIGVLDYVKNNGEDRITWQPETGVRSAAVITKYNNATSSGYVLVGRSLKEVEKREEMLTKQVGVAYIVTLILTFFGSLVIPIKSKSK